MSSDELPGEKFQFLNVKILSLDQIHVLCSCTKPITMKTMGSGYTCKHLEI